jgi:hypothetical protein
MQKTFSLTLAVCLALMGCSQPSSPWTTVRSARVDTHDSDDSSGAYAEHLSRVLQTANVEHKLVTYEYRYRTALREEAIGTRTAVIYRDDKNPRNPWWLMDERLYNPVWLPGDDENRQVSFYLHQPATVVSAKVIGDGDGKRLIGAPDASSDAGGMLARLDAVKGTDRSGRWEHIFARHQPQLVASAEPRKQPVLRPVHVRATAAATDSTGRYAAIFRERHGTAFDPQSLIDRRKMEQLVLLAGVRHAGLF